MRIVKIECTDMLFLRFTNHTKTKSNGFLFRRFLNVSGTLTVRNCICNNKDVFIMLIMKQQKFYTLSLDMRYAPFDFVVRRYRS